MLSLEELLLPPFTPDLEVDPSVIAWREPSEPLPALAACLRLAGVVVALVGKPDVSELDGWDVWAPVALRRVGLLFEIAPVGP